MNERQYPGGAVPAPRAIVADDRIPVVLGDTADATQDDAVLFEAPAALWAGASASFSAQQTHPAACTCCTARGPAGRALADLLHARARGKMPFFRRVIAVTRTEAGRAAILAALATDPIASACFRQAD